MSLNREQNAIVGKFLQDTQFYTKGAVITDLDGTSVHEVNKTIVIHQDIGRALKNIYTLGRPVVINTLRFPLSVIRTFGREWFKLSGSPIPVITLNGSQLGFIALEENEFNFHELAAFPMNESEIRSVVDKISSLIQAGATHLTLFIYSQDWKLGEWIWTQEPGREEYIKKKYTSASKVITGTTEELEQVLLSKSICMLLLLVESRTDDRMAYQHTAINNFITHEGVDKASGTREMSKLLQFDLSHSIGAGDTDMDNFLAETGMAVHVRTTSLPYNGKKATIKVNDFIIFSELLQSITKLQPVKTN